MKCKYQLVDRYSIQLEFGPKKKEVDSVYIHFNRLGVLTIEAGYGWNGPSGPTSHTPDSIRGSLVHDALYELMGRGLLDRSFKRDADLAFRQILLEDGMQPERANLWYLAVKHFGDDYLNEPTPVLIAPRPPDYGERDREYRD